MKNIITGGILYGISSLLPRAASLLLLPVYTKYLLPSEFGTFQLIITFAAFAKLIINLGLTTSFWKFYLIGNIDNGKVLVNIIFCQIMAGFLFIFLCLLIYLLFLPQSVLFQFLIILLAGEVIGIFYDTTLLVLRAHNHKLIYLGVSCIYSFLLFGLSILFIVVLKQNYNGAIYAYSTAYIFLGCSLYFFLRTKFRGTMDIQQIKEIIAYGAPIMLSNLAAIFVALADRPMLKLFVDDTELGLYTFGFKLGDITKMLLITPFFLAWNPLRWEIYRMNDGRKLFSLIYNFLFFGFSFFGLCLISCAPLLCLLFASNTVYYEGLAISPIIGLGNIFYGLYYYNAMGLLFENKSKQILFIVITASIFNVLLNLILIPIYGMQGAAFSSCTSYLLMYIQAIYFSQRCYFIERDYIFELSFVSILIIITLILSLLYSAMYIKQHYLTLFAFFFSGIYLIIFLLFSKEGLVITVKRIKNSWRSIF